MRTIKVEPLTYEAYAPYGTFYNMTEPAGYSLNGELHRFFPDRMTESYTTRTAFSPILVKKPEVSAPGIFRHSAGSEEQTEKKWDIVNWLSKRKRISVSGL